MIHTGDCIEVMRGMEADSVDAVVTDPPYGIGFMGKAWDAFDIDPVEASWSGKGRNQTAERDPTAATPGGRATTGTGFRPTNPRCATCGRAINGRDTPKGFKVCHCETPVFAPTKNRDAARFQQWCEMWAAEAWRVTKPGGYLLAFGGTRTHHRLVCGLEDAGWIIRDELDWIYASGFPKGRANLKPAHEPIVLARKPGPLRPLNIEGTRIGMTADDRAERLAREGTAKANISGYGNETWGERDHSQAVNPSGRWPSNLLLSDPELFDEPNPWVVGSGATTTDGVAVRHRSGGNTFGGESPKPPMDDMGYGDAGGYSRFFLIPKADRADREPVLRGQLELQPNQKQMPLNNPDYEYSDGSHRSQNRPRENSHATVKPTDLMRHLIRLVTPPGGTVLDCFAGSGSTILAAEMEGFDWIAIEREPEYVQIMEARLNGTQRGLGLDVGAPTRQKAPSPTRPGWRGHRATDASLDLMTRALPDEEPAA